MLGAADSSLRLQLDETIVFEAGAASLDGPVPPPGLRTVDRGRRELPRARHADQDAGLGASRSSRSPSPWPSSSATRRTSTGGCCSAGSIALLIAGLGTFAAAVGVLGPLRRLRSPRGRIAGEDDLDTRVSETDGPAEIRELAASFNGMLGRLPRAVAAATRRFTLDAGHELRTPLTTVQATLSALHRHPDVPPEQRTAMLADALDEQRRLVELLDGLQALARGDAMATAPRARRSQRGGGPRRGRGRAPAAVTSRWWCRAGRRVCGCSSATWSPTPTRHGGGGVWVTLTAAGELTVDDDGDGIPEADRERIFSPFERLPARPSATARASASRSSPSRPASTGRPSP